MRLFETLSSLRRPEDAALAAALATVLMGSLLALGCAEKSVRARSPNSSGSSPQLANPASKRCVDKGGKLVIERQPTGGEFGLCVFEDNRQCEEWALFRGDCPAGGIRITGYVTQAARYCAITGGRYAITARSGETGEQGTCTLPGGKTCDAEKYYRGECGR
jgi:putative hemolysin